VSKDTEWLLVQNDDDYKSLHNNNDREMYVLSEMSHVLDRITDRKIGGIDALSMGTMMMPCIS
jgi:hypothetical protein